MKIMSGHFILMRTGNRRGPRQSQSLLDYLADQRTRREEGEAERDEVIIDPSVDDADETPSERNPIFERCRNEPEAIYTLCGFCERDFTRLYVILEDVLTTPKPGRKFAIGPIDSLLLFLHWLRNAAPIDSIAVAFGLRTATLYKTMRKTAEKIRRPLVLAFITEIAARPLAVGGKFPDCGLIVDATVQKRGKPIGEFEEAKAFFSGKHHIYCLKSQVVINREGLAIHIVAGVAGSIHDLKLFRENQSSLASLIASHPGESTKILVDKGYIGEINNPAITLVTPKKKPAGGSLDQNQMKYNQRLSSVRVMVENYFGRLQSKFHIMVRRWSSDNEFYPVIFEICCALVNFDIIQESGLRLTTEEGTQYQTTLTHICQKGAAQIAAARERTALRNWRRKNGTALTEEEEIRQGVYPEDDETDCHASSGVQQLE
jgi:hypothetical protein